nr:immunoglobulin heavy chain junction region [Mus musculus]NSM06323.1 immunoglobulin heavy chain junction region [Mus musculus]
CARRGYYGFAYW